MNLPAWCFPEFTGIYLPEVYYFYFAFLSLVSLLFSVILITDFSVVSSSDTPGKQWKSSEYLEVHEITSSIKDLSKNTPNSLRELHGHFSFICWDCVMGKYLIHLFSSVYKVTASTTWQASSLWMTADNSFRTTDLEYSSCSIGAGPLSMQNKVEKNP